MLVKDYPPLTLEIMDMVGDKWTLLVVYTLGDAPLRFSELRRRTAPISQKMLTQTLRAFERDGLVRREAFATVPVTVEYSLTPLGDSLCEVIEGLRAWAYANAGTMNSARQGYNQQHP